MTAMALSGPLGEHATRFTVVFPLAFGCLVGMVRWFPRRLTLLQGLLLGFLLGLAVRLLFLPFPPGNDMFRYVWEGHIQRLGSNPYVVSPDDPSIMPLAQDMPSNIWKGINHKGLSACYPPFSMILFRFLASITLNPIWFKLVFFLLDLATMGLLAMMLWQRRLPANRLLIYAANPLVILSVSGEGHLDVIQVFFLVFGIFLFFRGRESVGFLCLGLAAMAKYVAGVALPFLVGHRTRYRWTIALLPLLLYLPFGAPGPHIFHSIHVFGTTMHYNDGITAMFRFLFGDTWIMVAIAVLAICLMMVYLTVPDPLRCVYMALGCMLLFLPTLHPWYLVLIAPFVVFYPSAAWIYLMAASAVLFPVVGIEYKTGIFQEIHWVKLIEYVPFYGLLAYGLFRQIDWAGDSGYPPPKSVAVVIPVLNEEDYIERCLASLGGQYFVVQTVVTDGGSADRTRQLARESGAVVISGGKGRGIQIARALAVVSADVIVVLHADCVLLPGTVLRMVTRLSDDPQAVGGAFGMAFPEDTGKGRFISWLNNWRARLTGISFGDQAQFFRSDAIARAGGFPPTLLMEDVEVCLRLKQMGRMLFIPEGVSVSDRRWQQNGLFRNIITVLRLFVWFLFTRRWHGKTVQNERFYKRYYPGVFTPEPQGGP